MNESKETYKIYVWLILPFAIICAALSTYVLYLFKGRDAELALTVACLLVLEYLIIARRKRVTITSNGTLYVDGGFRIIRQKISLLNVGSIQHQIFTGNNLFETPNSLRLVDRNSHKVWLNYKYFKNRQEMLRTIDAYARAAGAEYNERAENVFADCR